MRESRATQEQLEAENARLLARNQELNNKVIRMYREVRISQSNKLLAERDASRIDRGRLESENREMRERVSMEYFSYT
jgi:outer membrane protein TolC